MLIGGTVRSGKTTLSNLIMKKFKYSKCESDTIVNAFDKVFPEFGITHKNAEQTREKFEPFLFEVLNGFCRDLKYCNNVTVFPGSQFLPKNISKYEKLDKYIVIFLGVNAESPEDLLKVIREKDSENDWTYKMTDEWLREFAKKIIEESENLKTECEKYGFYYFDTFKDRELVLNSICDMIQNLQNND